MPDKYCWSGATGTGDGSSWANAYTTLAAAVTGAGAGFKVFVAHDHYETAAAAKTITSAGTSSNPQAVVCVNRAGSVPPVAADVTTGAIVETTGANAITINTGTVLYRGIRFNAGSGATTAGLTATTANGGWVRFQNCELRKLGTTATSAAMQLGAASSQYARVELVDSVLETGNATDEIRIGYVDFVMRGGSLAAAGCILMASGTTGAMNALFEGVDLSARAGNLVNGVQAAGKVVFKDCKINAAATFSVSGNSGLTLDMVRCDSGDTNYNQSRYQTSGTLTQETTIVRTGGASDGTTPIAWKIVTNSTYTSWLNPFVAPPIVFWNETVGSPITVTVEGIWGGGAVPTDEDIWIDVEYLGTSGFPLGLIASSTKANVLSTATALPAGSGTWGGSTTKFKLTKTITPQEKGPITVYVKAGKSNSTFYVDPKPVVS